MDFSGRRFLLFAKYKEIANLRAPNHLISKPIMAAMIFSGDCSLPKGFDTLDFDALTKLWQKVKHQLKNKDFLKKL